MIPGFVVFLVALLVAALAVNAVPMPAPKGRVSWLTGGTVLMAET